jgi:hypothetical protein
MIALIFRARAEIFKNKTRCKIPNESSLMASPRAFLTQNIPDSGKVQTRDSCNAKIWLGEIPPLR